MQTGGASQPKFLMSSGGPSQPAKARRVGTEQLPPCRWWPANIQDWLFGSRASSGIARDVILTANNWAAFAEIGISCMARRMLPRENAELVASFPNYLAPPARIQRCPNPAARDPPRQLRRGTCVAARKIRPGGDDPALPPKLVGVNMEQRQLPAARRGSKWTPELT